MPRGLVYVAGSERRILSHPGSPPSQTSLEICIQRGGLSIQDPAVWAVPGSPHFYTMHGCGSLPSETDGNPHTQLPQWLAHSGPVAGGFWHHTRTSSSAAYGAFPLHGTVRLGTTRYGTARLSSCRFAFPRQFSTALERAGLFTCRYNCAASTAVTSL